MPISPPDQMAHHKALEKAAKYVCTIKCGRCPFVEERFPCQNECSSETLPWQCWYAYFLHKAQKERGAEPGQDFTQN